MATQKSGAELFAALAIQELELALLREQSAWEDWELPTATKELAVMARIAKKVSWPAKYQPLIETFDGALRHARETVDKRDTTRMGAAQTKLEQAIFALRDRVY